MIDELGAQIEVINAVLSPPAGTTDEHFRIRNLTAAKVISDGEHRSRQIVGFAACAVDSMH
ncbi:hypothetical protein [Streptosporangium sp. NPDC051022]|uniref:hypothetical protein n=1 Tax=Streptosporangium sp. NPDC051022 TaxID=3155752 RepID=UPI00342BF82A